MLPVNAKIYQVAILQNTFSEMLRSLPTFQLEVLSLEHL